MDKETKKCPQCAEEIKLEAKVCRFCGAKFELIEKGYCKSCKEVVELDETGKCKKCGSKALNKHKESILLEEKLAEEAVKAPEAKPSRAKEAEEKKYHVDVGRIRSMWIALTVRFVVVAGALGALFFVPLAAPAAPIVAAIFFPLLIGVVAMWAFRIATLPREIVLSSGGLVLRKKDGSTGKSFVKILFVRRNRIIGVTKESKKTRLMTALIAGSMDKKDWKDFLASTRDLSLSPEIPTGIKVIAVWMYVLFSVGLLAALAAIGALFYAFYQLESSGMIVGPYFVILMGLQYGLLGLICYVMAFLFGRIAGDLRDLMPTGRILTIVLSILGVILIFPAIIYGPILWYMFRPEIKELYR